MNHNNIKFKFPILLLPLIFISLLLGIWTGLIRIGLNFPFTSQMQEHGALMTGSFIGTLICLERTITNPKKIALLVPLLNSLSLIFFLFKMPEVSFGFLFAGSIGLVVVYLVNFTRFPQWHIFIMMCGAFCWAVGNMLLIKTSFYSQAAMWWIAFLFFTILGERLELSHYLQIGKYPKILLIILLMLFISSIVYPFHGSGGYISALSLIGSAFWLFRYDMAKHSLKGEPQHFYSGLVLLTGYCWLFVCGFFMAYGVYSGLLYDAVLHSFFIGFTFSMIFAHAPVILPGVLGLAIKPFGKSLYIWFILLQISLIVRITGAFTLDTFSKRHGALINAVAILGFLINMLFLFIREKQKYNKNG
jgi:hypothetical protein